jgi:nitrogen-specific signal transduction histidine kinase
MDEKDDGPGIPENIQKRIFQPFFAMRADGTGLGLAACLKISSITAITHHKGYASV